jgi:LysM repeat protein
MPVAPAPRAIVTTIDEGTDAGATAVPAEEIRLAANQFERVVVQSGDSISRIAMRKYGQSNQTILDLLKLANPELHDVNVISVGQTLQLPDLSESSVVTYGDRRFAVLVYSTAQPTRAAALDAALRARGQHSRVVKGALSAGHPVFRVMIDGFADRAAAVSASRDVQRLFREDSRMAMLVH